MQLYCKAVYSLKVKSVFVKNVKLKEHLYPLGFIVFVFIVIT